RRVLTLGLQRAFKAHSAITQMGTDRFCGSIRVLRSDGLVKPLVFLVQGAEIACMCLNVDAQPGARYRRSAKMRQKFLDIRVSCRISHGPVEGVVCVDSLLRVRNGGRFQSPQSIESLADFLQLDRAASLCGEPRSFDFHRFS